MTTADHPLAGGPAPDPVDVAVALRPLWGGGVALTAVLSALLTGAGGLLALFSLAFFDDPSAPGAYSALFGMLALAGCCLATMAVPVWFGIWGRGARTPGQLGRRLGWCCVLYVLPLVAGTVQFGVLMH